MQKDLPMVTQVVKAPEGERYAPEIGDILYAGDYLMPPPKGDITEGFIHLSPINPNAWGALRSLQIDARALRAASEYECPYTSYRHNWVVPIAVLSPDTEKYRSQVSPWTHMAWDCKWMRRMWGEELFKLPDVSRILMGSGYTEGTNVYDGSCGRIKVRVPLENGDQLLCYAWEWYNK